MHPRPWWSAVLFLWACCASALASGPSEQLQAFVALMPELRYLDFVWEQAAGDLNGDGIDDVALLLTGSPTASAPREERLVVMAGLPGGGYKVLAVSGDFCHPSKFYGLEIRKRSVFVTAVETADAARWGGHTMQFRYNPRLLDLELVGEETDSRDEGNRESEHGSTNLLTGQHIQTTQRRGKATTTRQRIDKPAALARLNGFVCRP